MPGSPGFGGKITREIFDFPGGRRFHFEAPGGGEFAIWSGVRWGVAFSFPLSGYWRRRTRRSLTVANQRDESPPNKVFHGGGDPVGAKSFRGVKARHLDC